METILIVDDEPMNHEVLHAYLEGEYTLVDAKSGEEALEMIAKTPPDLVLLDVMMPGMGGFETARRLKASAQGQFLPIILVTALDDQTSRLTGLRTQADEFLTKPVDRQELMVRVRNLLTLRAQKQLLLRENVEHVELHRFKDEMSSMIVHDLKNPIAAVLANLDYVLDVPGGLEQSQIEALLDAQTASQRAIRLISNLLDVAGIEEKRFRLKRAPTQVGAMVDTLLQHRGTLARVRGLTIFSELDRDLRVELDGELVGRAIENILDNSFRYAPPGGRIGVFGEVVGSCFELRIANNGSAISEASRTRIFEKFGQSVGETGRMNLGLGLYFCRLAVEAHGGAIWVDEVPEFSTVFNLRFPMTDNRTTAEPDERLS